MWWDSLSRLFGLCPFSGYLVTLHILADIMVARSSMPAYALSLILSSPSWLPSSSSISWVLQSVFREGATYPGVCVLLICRLTVGTGSIRWRTAAADATPWRLTAFFRSSRFPNSWTNRSSIRSSFRSGTSSWTTLIITVMLCVFFTDLVFKIGLSNLELFTVSVLKLELSKSQLSYFNKKRWMFPLLASRTFGSRNSTSFNFSNYIHVIL